MSSRFAQHLRSCVSAFRRNSNGQVVVTFALTLVPVMTLVGVSVDYGSLVRIKAALQSDVDAVVLGAQQQNASNSGTGSSQQIDSNAKLLTYAQQFVPATSATYTAADGTMCVSAQRSINTSFLKVARISSMSAKATACSVNQTQVQATYEIALALDNTGSMATADWKTGKTKIASEITAAKNFVAQMFDAVPDTNMQISLVPFSTAVNVGTGNRSASWIDKLGSSSIHWENFPKLGTAKEISWNPQSRFDLFSQIGQAWGGCVEERPQPYTLSDDAPSSSRPDTLFVPLFAPDESDSPNKGYTSNNDYLSDNGGFCAKNDAYDNNDKNGAFKDGSSFFGDKQQELCKYARAWSGQSAPLTSPGTAANSGCSAGLQPIQTLTNKEATLTSQVNNMQASGNTNLVSGFMWAWRTISPNGPFTVGSSPRSYATAKNKKIIVFMTDGYNNWQANNSQNAGVYTAFGYYKNDRLGTMTVGGSAQKVSGSNQRSFLDASFLQACANAKDAGVEVYTVAFSIPNDPIDAQGQSVMKACATDSAHYYIATDGTELDTFFRNIGQSVTQSYLRLKS